MYIFTIGHHFDALLDMSLEEAERYAMRRMTGYKPSYRVTRGIAPDYHTIEYGLIPDYDERGHSGARLTIARPKTSLVDEWEEAEERKGFPDWEKFIEEARNHGSEDGYGYYQWPPLLEESE